MFTFQNICMNILYGHEFDICFLHTYQGIWWVYMCYAHMHINANMNIYIYMFLSTYMFVFQNICMNILYGHAFDI